MGAIADRVTDQFINPYTFPSSHKRILEPYNYYDFGQVQTQRCSGLQLHFPGNFYRALNAEELLML